MTSRTAHKRFPVGTLFTDRTGHLWQIIEADTYSDMFTIYGFDTDNSELCSFYVMTINVDDKYWKVYK